MVLPTTGKKYVIAAKLYGRAEHAITYLRRAIKRNFGANFKTLCPPLNLTGPCMIENEKSFILKMEKTVKSCNFIGFRFGVFKRLPDDEIRVEITPSKELIKTRQDMVEELAGSCNILNSNLEFHITLCSRLNFQGMILEDANKTLGKVWKFLDSWKMPKIESYVLRIAILEENGATLCEYDTMSSSVLSGSESLDEEKLRKASEMIMTKKCNARDAIVPLNEDYSEKIFIISDLHFDHKNIIKYCNRPFWSVQEMNRVMTNNWNRTVGENDRVYFLGDMTYGRGRKSIDFWLSRLNGKIRFIRGNHDTDSITRAHILEDGFPIRYKGWEFLLMHSPYRQPNWNGWAIHGHVHNSNLTKYPHINVINRTINICVELIEYTPLSLDGMIASIKQIQRDSARSGHIY